MNNNLTEVIFILDRSGSMQSLVPDTIGGFNAFVKQQKKEVGEARLTTILFDDKYEVIHDQVNIQNVPELTTKEYTARGMTAMLDAIGRTINSIGERLAKTDENERPGKVVVVITTDGQENASKEFHKAQIKEMIERQQNEYNWKFLFLGANIDSASEAGSLGIDSNFAVNYSATSIGTQSLYSAVSKGVSSVRCCTTGNVSLDWANEIK